MEERFRDGKEELSCLCCCMGHPALHLGLVPCSATTSLAMALAPQLPPWLADSPPYQEIINARRERGRGDEAKRDYFLLLRELNWFTAGSGECQSLCRREEPQDHTSSS